MRQINDAGLNIIKSFEGIEDGDPSTVNLDPYIDPVGIWTIGWGHAIIDNGKFVTIDYDPYGVLAKSFYPDGITYEEAESLLEEDIEETCYYINRYVKIPLNNNQFSALVSFTFNVGINNLLKSTLLKKLNIGDYLGAADEFPKWRKSNGKIFNGLVRRRKTERDLFLT